MKVIDRDTYELSTGRRFYANVGLVSINHRGDIREGYDGHIYTDGDPGTLEPWTAIEKAELAAYMISLWRHWGDNAGERS